MKKYVEPELELIYFTVEDVITTSSEDVFTTDPEDGSADVITTIPEDVIATSPNPDSGLDDDELPLVPVG